MSEPDEHDISQTESTREQIIAAYRDTARRYYITANLYYVFGYPERAHRRRAVQALGLGRGVRGRRTPRFSGRPWPSARFPRLRSPLSRERASVTRHQD